MCNAEFLTSSNSIHITTVGTRLGAIYGLIRQPRARVCVCVHL